MSIDELSEEIQKMSFFGWQEEKQLVGVMGFQRVRDVTLIRHAYVLTAWQRQGIGSQLVNYLRKLSETRRLLVGTWADAHWAIAFYQKHGFHLLADKDKLLRAYWRVSDRQIEVSVFSVLTCRGEYDSKPWFIFTFGGGYISFWSYVTGASYRSHHS